MSIGRYGRAPSLAFTAGQDASNIITNTHLQDFISVMIFSPANIDGKTYYFEGNADPLATSGSSGWATIKGTDGASLALPIINACQRYDELPLVGALRMRATVAPTIAVVFQVSGVQMT